jgi:hypothetical protein
MFFNSCGYKFVYKSRLSCQKNRARSQKVRFAIIQKKQEHIFRHQCKLLVTFSRRPLRFSLEFSPSATFEQIQFCPPNFSRGAAVARRGERGAAART